MDCCSTLLIHWRYTINRLFHYTSLLNLGSILVDGALSRGRIPISPSQSIDGVWATSDPDPDEQIWARLALVDKTEVRLRFQRAADFVPWADFARQAGVDPGWFIAFNEAAGPSAAHWFVSPEAVDVSAALIEVRRPHDRAYEEVSRAAAKKLCLASAEAELGEAETSARRLPPFRQRDAMIWLQRTRQQLGRLSGVKPVARTPKEKFKWAAPGPWYS